MDHVAPSSLEDLHEVILMIAKDFDSFCCQYNINYYLMGGTALGAARHGGFIPWDDDFDVFMDQANYKRFMTLAPAHLEGEKYYLQAEDTAEWPLHFSKLRLNGSRYREADNEGRSMHEGIFIDIMCLNSAYDSRPLRWLQFAAGKALSAGALARRGYKTHSTLKRLAMSLAKHIVRGPVKCALLRIVRRSGDARVNSRLVGHFFGRAPFHATSFERAWLGTPRRVAFEDTEFSAPHALERYLEVRFGPDYMTLPSAAVRASFPSHVVDFDVGNRESGI